MPQSTQSVRSLGIILNQNIRCRSKKHLRPDKFSLETYRVLLKNAHPYANSVKASKADDSWVGMQALLISGQLPISPLINIPVVNYSGRLPEPGTA